MQWPHPSESLNRCICGSCSLTEKYTYTNPPYGETDFRIENYYRKLYQCDSCMHFMLIHDYDFESLYTKEYVSRTYNKNLEYKFNKIINLPPEKSDNYHRVERIKSFFSKDSTKKVLDVGSGLCVFLYWLRHQTGWECYALDPDKSQCAHASSLNINAICSDFKIFESDNDTFDLITFNKVLEHIKNPISFLVKAKKYLDQSGVIYIEMPDGEAAYADSPLREEFFIEHYHAFSLESMLVLARASGLEVIALERVREPSGKYTLRMFCKK